MTGHLVKWVEVLIQHFNGKFSETMNVFVCDMVSGNKSNFPGRTLFYPVTKNTSP